MIFTVKDDKLLRDGQPVAFLPSPNQGARMEPNLVVLHDTAGPSAQGAIDWFKQAASKVSAHLVVAADGTVTQMVEFDRVAWHAGPSSWNGRSGCNGFAIGIEIANPGGLTGSVEKAVAWYGKAYGAADGVVAATTPKHSSKLWVPYTEAQLATVEAIVAALGRAYPTITGLAGHHDISPGRKEDPTPLMPWARMQGALGPRLPPPHVDDVAEVQAQLAELGYHLGANDGILGPRTRAALRTFQEQNKLPITGAIDPATEAALDGKPKEMPLANRATLGLADLQEAGSTTVASTQAIKRTSEGAAALITGNALWGALEAAAATLSRVDQGVATLQQTGRTLEHVGAVLPWLATPRGVMSLVLLAWLARIWWKAHRAEAARIAAARLGTNVGG